MTKKSSSCAICENLNLSSFCAGCVNFRLNECYASLRSLHSKRNSLYARLERALEAKKKMEEQLSWRLAQKERIKKLKERLHNMQKQLSQERALVAKESDDLKSKNESIEVAFSMLKGSYTDLENNFHSLKCTHEFRLMAISSELLHKQAVVVKQICKVFPMRWKNFDAEARDGTSGSYDTICDARLPRGLDPQSVPSDELSASLGYMIQLLNIISPSLASPALHTSGFAGSCSRTWQRDSYWVARPSSQSKEYPLFVPRKNFSSSGGDASWSERSSSNFGVASVESEKKTSLESAPSSSFNHSMSSLETLKDLQKGISLLKKSVACITAYCNHLYCLDSSFEASSTFEAFAKALATLSSSKEMRAVISHKTAKPKLDNKQQAQPLNESVWKVTSTASASTLLESAHNSVMMITGSSRNHPSSDSGRSVYLAEARKSETVDGWDLIEHPILPPPSQVEDIEHWTRAILTDSFSTRK